MKPLHVFPLCISNIFMAYGALINLQHDHTKKLLLPAIEHNPGRAKLSTRRIFFSSAVPISFLIPLTISVESVSARDELFKPNPLTNPILEQFRIWDQAEADQQKYGGELAPGSSVGRETYSKLLVPILRMSKDINKIYDLVREPAGLGLEQANGILCKPEFQKIGFKKMFNVFADNIYYSDPDRANVYLAGGALPKNEQSIAYLLRNDILTNIEALQAEVEFQLKNWKSGNPLDVEDLLQYSEDAMSSMSKYLDLVPPVERKNAEALLN